MGTNGAVEFRRPTPEPVARTGRQFSRWRILKVIVSIAVVHEPREVNQ